MLRYISILLLSALLAVAPISVVGYSQNLTSVEKLTVHAQETCGDSVGGEDRSCNLSERIADRDGFVFGAWRVTRSTVNILLIIALIVISFSSIFRVTIDSYTVKKALPNILIGVVLANASLFIIRYIADISTVVTYFFVEQSELKTFQSFIGEVIGAIGLNSIIEGTKFSIPGTGTAAATIIILIIGIIVAIGSLWLAVLLYVRLAVAYILTILSPLAFIAYGIPGMEKYFKQWWQIFIKWIFMLPAMAAVFWLMLLVSKSGEGSLMQLIITYILFFTALAIPVKWGGSIMGKVSDGFQKYTGLNAGRKWLSDEAKLRGEQVMAKSPIGRLQVRNELRKKNIEDSIKAAKTKHAKAVRMRTTGTGKNRKTRLTRAGRQEAALGEIMKGFENELEEAKNQSISEFYRDPNNKDLLDRLKIKEMYKDAAEKRNSQAQKNHAKDLDQRSGDDEKIAKAIEDLASAVADEEVIAGEIKRNEGITNGNAMSALYQIPQLLGNYLEAQKHVSFLEERAKGETGDQKEKTEKEIEMTKRQALSIKRSYEQMQERGRAKIGNLDLKEVDIETAHQLMDGSSDYAKKNITAANLAQGQQRQALKSFNAGVTAQIKDEIKEQTVPQLQRELDDYMKKLGSMNIAKIKEDTGIDINHEEIKRAYFEGDTATLSAIGLKDHEVRAGRVIAEKYKTIQKSVNDVRHSEATATWMEASNKAIEEGKGTKIFDDEDIKMARNGSVQQKRTAAAKSLSNGVMSGSPGFIVQQGENVDNSKQNYNSKGNKGQGGSGATDDEEDIFDDEQEPEPEENEGEEN